MKIPKAATQSAGRLRLLAIPATMLRYMAPRLRNALLVSVALGAGVAAATDAALTPDPGLAVRDALPLPKVTMVIVDKSDRTMRLIAGDRIVRTYRVSLGGDPVGRKRQEGDQKTPEGLYRIDWRNPTSAAYRSMHISYPSADDQAQARENGVSAGGNIMIHGQLNGLGWLWRLAQYVDWTNGCIAVANHDMDEIIDLVPVGTPIAIRP